MLLEPKFLFVWLLLTLIFFWKSNISYRPIILLISSFLILFILYPGALIISLILGLIAYFYSQLNNFKKSKLLKYSIAFSILPLILFRILYPNYNIIIHFGMTFVTLRCISLIIDSYTEDKKLDLVSSINYVIFFPLFSAGPIETKETFFRDNFSNSFNFDFFFNGNLRLILGLFKSIFICDQIIKPFYLNTWPNMEIDPLHYNWLDVYQYIFSRFLYTYLNFSAYCDIAIGISAMFGFKIKENFNFPLLASNVQNFWRRWHLTLGSWITQYLYFPLLAKFKGRFPYIKASIFTFLIIGLWHELEAGYLFWGIFHGLGLATCQFINKELKSNKIYIGIKNLFFYKYICIILTLSFVSWLQTVANMNSFSSAMKLTSILFFLG